MDLFLFAIALLAALAGVIYGLFLFIARAGKRKRGLMVAGLSIIAFFAFAVVSANVASKSKGWENASAEQAAKAAGITDPTIWARHQSDLAAAEAATKAASEKAVADAKAQAEAEQQRKGFHCLSAWDGSHTGLIAQVKAQLREPDSFEHIETRIAPVDENGDHAVAMKYRARNGFGGMNVETALATVKSATCAATLVAME